MSNSDHPFRFFFYFGVPVLSSDAKRGGIGECGCLQQVLFGAPELFCMRGRSGASAVLFSSMLLYVDGDHRDYWGREAQDGHLDFHTAPEFCFKFSVALRPQSP